MRTKFGNFFIILGTVLIVAALFLFLWNQQEARQAGESVDAALPVIKEQISHQQAPTEPEDDATTAPETAPTEPPLIDQLTRTEMTVVDIDGYGYIGYLAIPKLALELPVMSDWSYPQLKKSPCRYSGSTWTDDLTILAHNYARHFGKLSSLSIGDSVFFTDMDGNVTEYAVAAVDVLDPYAVEDVTVSGFDLVLFTCTYGGKNRVAVFCDRVG